MSRLLPRRDGLKVCEGICPHCKRELMRLSVRYFCPPCGSFFVIRDPKDDIEDLIKSSRKVAALKENPPVVAEQPLPMDHKDPNPCSLCGLTGHGFLDAVACLDKVIAESEK